MFIDIHEESLQILEKNLEWALVNQDLPTTAWQYRIIHSDVHALENDGRHHGDVVIENPPFGTKQRSHIDRVFLLEAFKTAPRVFSFHKSTSDRFIQRLSKDNGFEADVYRRYSFQLKKTQHYHTAKNKRIEVTAYRCIRQE
jgi:predicted RNA methylase